MIAAGGKHFDAAKCLFELLAARREAGIGEGRPLFCHASGKSITTEEVRCIHGAARDGGGWPRP